MPFFVVHLHPCLAVNPGPANAPMAVPMGSMASGDLLVKARGFPKKNALHAILSPSNQGSGAALPPPPPPRAPGPMMEGGSVSAYNQRFNLWANLSTEFSWLQDRVDLEFRRRHKLDIALPSSPPLSLDGDAFQLQRALQAAVFFHKQHAMFRSL